MSSLMPIFFLTSQNNKALNQKQILPRLDEAEILTGERVSNDVRPHRSETGPAILSNSPRG